MGHRLGRPPDHGSARDADRHQAAPRAVQGRGTDPGRPAGRRDQGRLRRYLVVAAADPRRQAARAGGQRHAPRAGHARGADHDRARLSVRHRQLVWPVRARPHQRRDRAAAQCRGQPPARGRGHARALPATEYGHGASQDAGAVRADGARRCGGVGQGDTGQRHQRRLMRARGNCSIALPGARRKVSHPVTTPALSPRPLCRRRELARGAAVRRRRRRPVDFFLYRCRSLTDSARPTQPLVSIHKNSTPHTDPVPQAASGHGCALPGTTATTAGGAPWTAASFSSGGVS
ncbi:hypothetical protein CBM2592_B80100 [Cupriavidus taiwanensis]|nr:hypothetical protein CBM2592_B80100 [Cupriavidus taiwanensis]SOY72941.1 hypothetical protein CBM2588_B80097 [Cupriavidus taiwanensis]SOY96911.1 hypothetical protein CBM2591_B60100 [Cupriavidus taiwanensis]SOZ93181.1 hypothetical protein CBM2621_B100098 [Cupriavidus taiwanensis]